MLQTDKAKLLIKAHTIHFYFILLFLFQLNEMSGQQSAPDDVFYRVFLTGNAADIPADSPFYSSFRQLLYDQNDPFSVVVSGDITAADLSDKTALRTDSQKISRLLETIKGLNNGNMYLLPGDRDWADSGKDGLKNVNRLEKLLKTFDQKNVKWLPKNGCPGPEVIDLHENLRLLVINTQWWNHPFDRPDPEDADCQIASDVGFIEELEDLIVDSKGKNILIAGHFPIFSLGEYGGNMPLSKHLLPLPIIGSFNAAYRQNIGSSKDIVNDRFSGIRQSMEDLFFEYDPIIYASGHERTLQVLREQSNFFVNSGAIGKQAFAAGDKQALHSSNTRGLVELVYYSNGKISSNIHELRSDGFHQTESHIVLETTCEKTQEGVLKNFSFMPCLVKLQAINNLSNTSGNMARVKAGEQYQRKWLGELVLGKHYRSSWTKELDIPYLNLNATFEGLTPYSKGGGRQTKSLKFKAGNGKEYTFRSIDKDPVRALAYDLRESIAAIVFRDQTTTQHPFGSLVADELLNHLDILHASPTLYVLPDVPELGAFREDYGGLFGALEELPKGPKKVSEAFQGADDIDRSAAMFNKLYKDHDNILDVHMMARARLFDIFVGDWSKHEDNWKWAAYKKEDGGYEFKPIPRDRDHVFSKWDGILPWIADREWAVIGMENFGKEIKQMKDLTYQARHMDRFLLSGLSKEDWLNQAKFIQQNLNDALIEKAVRKMPKEAYKESGLEIEEKLKARLPDMHKYAEEFYLLLSKYVDVKGSNKQEYFLAKRNRDGSVTVQVYNKKKKTGAKGNKLLYDRTLYPEETKEIRLFGLAKDDTFEITGSAESSIKIRVIGGKGEDVILERSKVAGARKHTFIYETNKSASIEVGEEGKLRNRVNQDLYRYHRTAFHYNSYLPIPILGYSSDDGFSAGLSVSFTTHNFEKEDYASKHKISALVATESGVGFSTSNRFHHAIQKWDILLDAGYNHPDQLTYFFGLGNETVKNETPFDADFYKTKHKSLYFQAGLVRDFWKRSNFGIKLRYEKNSEKSADNTILGKDSRFFGSQNLNMAEGIVEFDLDFRNHKVFPDRGIRLFVSNHLGLITAPDKPGSYGITEGFMEFLTSTKSRKHPVTLALKAGGAHGYGKESAIPYYKTPSLGQTSGLRGYYRNRFTAQSAIYTNAELRLQLLDVVTPIIPLKMGIFAFYDTGRVFVENDESELWHKGYGAGIYFTPLSRSLTISVSAGFSEEESGLILFSIGTGL